MGSIKYKEYPDGTIEAEINGYSGTGTNFKEAKQELLIDIANFGQHILNQKTFEVEEVENYKNIKLIKGVISA